MELINLSSKLTLLIFLFFFFIIIDKSLSIRTFGNPNQKRLHNHHKYHEISFLMQNVLNATHPLQKPATNKATTQIPFHKPLGFLPPNGGIPLPQSNPTVSISGSSQQLDATNIGISFPARATLQELEFGSLMQINEDLFEGGKGYGSSSVVGRAQGVFVASAEDRADHMMAMAANFGRSGFKDGLRFFGMLKKDAEESHIAVIGGMGKYDGANGYAVIKEVDSRSNALSGNKNSAQKLLLFHVYLS